jgi:hypothetical protein
LKGLPAGMVQRRVGCFLQFTHTVK